MRKNLALFSALSLIMVMVNGSLASVIKQTIRFGKSSLRLSTIQQYDIITSDDLELQFEEGKPQLPYKLIHLTIPDGEKVAGIRIVKTDREMLERRFYLFPGQPAQALSFINSRSDVALIAPEQTIYQSNEPYPRQVVSYLGTGKIQGDRVASFVIYPLQYIPQKRKVYFYSEIHFDVLLTEHASISADAVSGVKSYFKLINNISPVNKLAGTPAEEHYPYVIITTREMKSHFQPLSDWKTQKGVRSKIVELDWIVENFSGGDNAEKVRNFIKYAYENWESIWILLGGDTNLVPHRVAFAMDCEFGASPDENQIPCDLYFSDLDGDWDANRNEIYGEVADNVDMFPEVYVGRASLSNAEEIDGWVNKIIDYEKNPPTDYQKNILFICQLLWTDPYTDTGVGKDMIEQETLPAGFYNVSKLYESLGNLNKTAVIQEINEGQLLINHTGHAWWSLMSLGDGALRASDMNSLNNGSRTSVIFSIGCWPAAFDYNCVAEAFIANPHGGGVAFVGNSRYGWGSPGNPGFGYSDRFDYRFFYFLFKEKCASIGQALALAKAYYVPFARQENVYRWCMYEINLLGDPEMPLWTDIPQELSVDYPSTLTVGNNSLTITVTHEGQPIKNARICLMQNEDVYETTVTDDDGQSRINIYTENAAQKITLTVTAPNYLPHIGSINMATDKPYLSCTNVVINDDDGILNPGESAYLTLKLKNFGTTAAENVIITLSSDSAKLKVLAQEVRVDQISALDSILMVDAFQVAADSSCFNGNVFYPEMTVAADQGEWRQKIAITIGTPVFQIYDLVVKDENENQHIEPGEQVKIFVHLKNGGKAAAGNVEVFIYSDDQNLSLHQNELRFGELAVGEIAVDSLNISISASCPAPHFPTLILRGWDENGNTFQKSFTLSIGKLGFYDDLESGADSWELPSTMENSWHLSSIRSHSGTHSWYCGQETDTTYLDDNESVLLSPYFQLTENARLSFWLWYDVAIYSKPGYEGDGVHVEFFDGIEWRNLDFIGTGGALLPVLMGNDWLEYTYDVSLLHPITNARLKFTFVSDPFWSKYPEPHEGAYIDDIKVSYQLAVSGVQETEPVNLPHHYELSQNYPNPFNARTTIKYQISDAVNGAPVLIQIYNLLGQHVKTLVDEYKQPGSYRTFWDGRNDEGRTVVSGIYLCHMNVKDQFSSVRKLILLE